MIPRCGDSALLRPLLTSCCLLLIVLRSAEPSGAVLTAPVVKAPAASGPASNITAAAAAAAAHPALPQAATSAHPVAAATAATTRTFRKPKHLCDFPFWYRGQWHHECLEYGSKGARWCALTQNFTRDELWRECARYDLMRYKCTLPFHYQGKPHSRCQLLSLEPLAKPTFWCALVPALAEVTWSGLGTDWVFCESPNATDSAYLKAVGPHRSLEEVAAAAKTTGQVKVTTTVVTTVITTNTVTTAAPKSTSVATSPPSSVKVQTAIGAAAVAAAAAAAAAASSADSSGGGAAAASSPGSALGIALAVVGVVLATVAVAAAFVVHRRHQYRRIDPLLSSEPAAEKSSYGGMQAYHD